MLIGVVGAGIMGRGIAQVAVAAGHEVRLFDVVPAVAEGALKSIRKGLDGSVKRGKLTDEAADAAESRLHAVGKLSDMSDADLVIEAVAEDLKIKQGIFRDLEQVVGPGTVLASNTSSLSIGAVASAMESRSRLIGLHFFNPVPAMKLIEIVLRPDTDAAIAAQAKDFAESLGKVGIVVQDSPGFLVNLAGRAYVTEALAILRDSIASVHEIDRISREVLGFSLGPFELMDLTGLDVNYPVTENLYVHNFGDPRLRSTWYHRYLLESGNLGRKTGAGFYRDGDDSTRSESTYTAGDAPAPRVEAAGSETLTTLLKSAGLELVARDEAELTVIDPRGKDLHTTALERGLDPCTVVAIDTFISDPAVLTLMVGPGTDPSAVRGLAAALATIAPVTVINDSPGFIAQRLLTAIMNLACDIAQRGVAAPADIDTAVTLGLRYPYGPLAWADSVGPERVVEILDGMVTATGDTRYRPSPWLARRASARLSCLTEDFRAGHDGSA